MSGWLSKSIAEIYEREQPELCSLIKELVSRDVMYNDFTRIMKEKIGFDYGTSITYSASLTLFKYYKELK